jgi:hypothetical protein
MVASYTSISQEIDMPTKKRITQAELKARLYYDPKSGIFSWRPCLTSPIWWNRTWAGKPAGTVKDGYIQISIDGRLYRAHHLAFLWMTGRIPDLVDH